MKRKSFVRPGAVLGIGAAAVSSSVLALRAWQRRWNATDEEASQPLPLDDQVSEPTYVTNRAITVAAVPERIWPWIAQMGELPRGGFYSYVTIERLLKMKIANADHILPGFQTLEVGAAIDRAGNMIVKAVEPGRVLVLGPPPIAEFRLDLGDRPSPSPRRIHPNPLPLPGAPPARSQGPPDVADPRPGPVPHGAQDAPRDQEARGGAPPPQAGKGVPTATSACDRFRPCGPGTRLLKSRLNKSARSRRHCPWRHAAARSYGKIPGRRYGPRAQRQHRLVRSLVCALGQCRRRATPSPPGCTQS